MSTVPTLEVQLEELRARLLNVFHDDDVVQEVLIRYWTRAHRIVDPWRWCLRVGRMLKLEIATRRCRRDAMAPGRIVFTDVLTPRSSTLPSQEHAVLVSEVLAVFPADALSLLNADRSSRKPETSTVRVRLARARAQVKRDLQLG